MTRAEQAEETRRRLLSAARSAFEEQGYEATSVRDVVSRAGTARGTFYLYFENRDDVLGQIIAEAVMDLRHTAGGPWSQGDYRDSVEAATLRFLRAVAASRGLWRCAVVAAVTSPEVVRAWREARREFDARIAANLRRGQELGQVRPLDPDAAADVLGGMIEHWAQRHITLADPPAEDEELVAGAVLLAGLWVAAVAAG